MSTLSAVISLDYYSWPVALAIFGAFATPIVILGIQSLGALGTAKQLTTMGLRLTALALGVLAMAGAKYERPPKDVEVIVLRDVSDSTQLVRNLPKGSLTESIDAYLREAADLHHGKRPEDRIGIVRFQQDATIEAMSDTRLRFGQSASTITGRAGTDPASAIQLALAMMRRDAMHRLLLISDGNATQGDLDSALALAVANGVPIDVMPLNYSIDNEVVVDSFHAPALRGEKDPFALSVVLKSTNKNPVTGTVRVSRGEQAFATRKVTLNPGLNPFRFPVPGLTSAGVHQFRVVFDADPVDGGNGLASDTLSSNNAADAFTFVRGRGRTLLVDNMSDGQGAFLVKALAGEGIDILPENRISPREFPTTAMQLQGYDTIILANVPRGFGGLNEDQFKLIAEYVYDTGGGLVTIGGDAAYGAGGWGGSAIERVLPVSLDVPAKRQIPKGALVLAIDRSGSMGGALDGRTKLSVAQDSALLASETLSTLDSIGVIGFDSAVEWPYPFGQNITRGVKIGVDRMTPGGGTDILPALDEAYRALAFKATDARIRHILLLTDGMSTPNDYGPILQKLRDKNITLSTVGIGPDHDAALLIRLAKEGRGSYYGVKDSQTLPQVFIKEATIVRRSMLQESLPPERPFSVSFTGSTADFVKGLQDAIPGSTRGYVLTARKPSPMIETPMIAGPERDPLLAYMPAGLGRVVSYMSDAEPKWSADMVASRGYAKFWAQMVRAVARPAMSNDFTVQTIQNGTKTKIRVEAIKGDNSFQNFLTIGGRVLTPDGPVDVKLVQSGPGTYEGEFPANQPGNYVVALSYNREGKEQGTLATGLTVNQSPEQRDLSSNFDGLQEIARRTGGRVLKPFDASSADLFSRAGLVPVASPIPIWDLLLAGMMGMVLLDVAARRIAWDRDSIAGMFTATATAIRSRTHTTRKVDNVATLEALKATRTQVAEDQRVPSEDRRRPDPGHKFDGNGVEGDVTFLVGGASQSTPKQLPTEPEAPRPNGDTLGALLSSKRKRRN